MESTICPDIPTGTQLIETFRWDPVTGPARIDLHLDRMCSSAKVLGYAYSRTSCLEKIGKITASVPLRCRMTLGRDGAIGMTQAALGETAAQWRVQFALTRLSADDFWLRHKTTQRALYDADRAALPSGIDEYIYLNDRDEVCEGTITTVFAKINGIWKTPPLSSGCLPGVLRQAKIEDASCRVGIITREDLENAEQIHVGNALRGEIPAVLTS